MTNLPNLAPASNAADPDIIGELQQIILKLPTQGPERFSKLRVVLASLAMLEPIERDSLLKLIKQVTGIELSTLRAEMASVRKEEPDHLALARATLKSKGPENVIFAEGCFWTWGLRV